MSQHRTKVLAAYKELLSLIRRLPGDRQIEALAEARATMRQHAGESDLGRQSDLFKQLAAKISFLRMVTPKRSGETSSIGAGHYVLRDGELVPGVGRSVGTRRVPSRRFAPCPPVSTPLLWNAGWPTARSACLRRMSDTSRC